MIRRKYRDVHGQKNRPGQQIPVPVTQKGLEFASRADFFARAHLYTCDESIVAY